MSNNHADGLTIELIEGKRTSHGYTEYYIKWKNQTRKKNTWLRADSLDCKDLIAAYEDRRNNRMLGAISKGKTSKVNGKCPKRKPVEAVQAEEHPSRLGSGLEVEKILGATDVTGELIFLVKWTHTQETELVPAKVANLRWPQVVIQFYEERLRCSMPTAKRAGNLDD